MASSSATAPSSSPRRIDLRDLARSESGFTLVEVMVAALVTAVGLLAMVGVFDGSRKLVSQSERKEAAVHVGERAMEKILGQSYASVALTSTPTRVGSDPDDPRYYVTGDNPPRFQYNRENTSATEPFVVDATQGTLSGSPTDWQDGRWSGTVHRFVTWVDDPNCRSADVVGPDPCPGTEDYKRVTVAVTIRGEGGPKKPILLSAVIPDPDAAPPGSGVVLGDNPLANPDTTCTDGSGNQVPCFGTGPGGGRIFYLYDTPAAAGARQAITASHPAHPTVAPNGTCTSTNTSGCPQPDLMDATAPPTSDPLPALFNYSTDSGGTYAGGRALVRDAACNETPSSSDNLKGQMWVTNALASSSSFNGKGGLTLSTQTVGGVSGAGTLCVAIYDVPGSITNLVSAPPTLLGTAVYSLDPWPAEPTLLSFNFNVREGQSAVTVASGRRLGLRVWAAPTSAADLAVLYDHPSHASFLRLTEVTP